MRGAHQFHPKHLCHVCYLGRVEAQRLVERRRLLLSRKKGKRCGARCGPPEAEGRGAVVGRKRRARGGSDGKLTARARAERTMNMAVMSVTLEVSKLSGWLNTFAVCQVESRAYDAGRDAGRGRCWESMARRWRKRRALGGLI